MVWCLLGKECTGLVWRLGEPKGSQPVLGVEIGLIDEPVIVRLAIGSFVEQDDGLRHGAWYGGLGYPRMMFKPMNGATEVEV